MSTRLIRLTGSMSALCCALVITVSCAAQLDLSDPDQALKATRKIICGSLTDGKTRMAFWYGHVYSRVPAEKDRHLMNVIGVNTRQCGTVNDAKRGTGFRSVSREIMLYLDPETDEVLKTWKNPWTGEEVKVFHVANDPVNMRQPMFALQNDGTARKFNGRRIGKLFAMTSEVPLFYDNPLAGPYQDQVGGKYQAIEMFNQFVEADDLLDGNKANLETLHLAWTRMAQWLPWMKMGDHPGQMIFHTHGAGAPNVDSLPASLREEMQRNYPKYFEPPPLDDKRPNETSWTYYKKRLEANAE